MPQTPTRTARGEFVWVQDGVGTNGQHQAQLVTRMAEMSWDDLTAEDYVEVRYTLSGRYGWVPHGKIEYPPKGDDERSNGRTPTRSRRPSQKKTAIEGKSSSTIVTKSSPSSPVKATKKSITSTPRKVSRKSTPRKRSRQRPISSSEQENAKGMDIIEAKSSLSTPTSHMKIIETFDSPPAKRQKKTNPGENTLFDTLTAPFVSAGKLIASTVSGFSNVMFGNSSK